jgi:hypothetical protein
MKLPEYSYSYDRIDYVPLVKCSFCKKILSKGQAIILTKNSTGEDTPTGPICAVKHAGKLNKKIPNFTRISFTVADDTDHTTKPKKHKKRVKSEQDNKEALHGHKAHEYIRLRIEKLKDFTDAYYPPLLQVWERFKCSNETTNDIEHIKRLIEKSKVTMPLLSPENLQACYAYSYWLEAFRKENGSNDYIDAMLKHLKSKCFLTIKQIEGINRWFECAQGYPQLDRNAFKKAIKIDAVMRPWIYNRSNND